LESGRHFDKGREDENQMTKRKYLSFWERIIIKNKREREKMKRIMPTDKKKQLIRVQEIIKSLETALNQSLDYKRDIEELYEYDASEYLGVFGDLFSNVYKAYTELVKHKIQIENDEVIE
jgi:hypothetical protein